MLHRSSFGRLAMVATMTACGFAATASPQTKAGDRAIAPIAGQTLPSESLREARFRILDLNGDRYITADEIDKRSSILRSQFDSLDWNHDGKLSEPEYVLNGRPK